MAFVSSIFWLSCRIVGNLITSYYFISLYGVLFSFYKDEIDADKVRATLTAAIITGIYWLVRLVFYIITYFTELPYKKMEREMKLNITKLELEAQKRKNEREEEVHDVSTEIERIKRESKEALKKIENDNSKEL